jgi:hypothetical protein
MIFFKRLKNSIGGLLRLKTQFWWYNGEGWDNHPGRVCLILDAYEGRQPIAAAETLGALTTRGASATVLLLIDGSPTWVWVDEQNTEIMKE